MRTYILFITLLCTLSLKAQIVDCTPSKPTGDDEVTVTFDLTKCSFQKASLVDFEGPIYSHMGVITSESPSGTEWKSRIALWPDKTTPDKCNIDAVKLQKVGDNLWQLKITPSVKEFFMQNTQMEPPYEFKADEQLLSIEFVLRNADGTMDGRVTGDKKSNIKLLLSHTITPGEDNPRPEGVQRGINYHNDESLTLVLFAPGKQFAYLMSELSNWEVKEDYRMKRDGDYFWITLNHLIPGKEYAFYYLVDGLLDIADPYANKILERKFDKGISPVAYPNLMEFPEKCKADIVSVWQTAKPEYPWEVTDFKGVRQDRLTIYELLLRDFTRNGEYKGNLKLALEKLDYLKSLGINAIELMPFCKIDGITNWGYHSTFFFATEKVYGTEEDYKKFIDECHKRGIAVIMDIVLDHAYGTCSLVRLYADPPGNTKAQPAADNPWFNMVSPNTKYSWGADFNHESKETQILLDSICAFWLKEYKLDGFRFDFSKGFTNTPGDGSAYDPDRIRIIKRLSDEIRKRKSDAYLIYEHLAGDQEEKELAEHDLMLWGKQNSPFSNAINGIQKGSSFKGAMASSKGWSKNNRVTYMESHDEERVAYNASVNGIGEIRTELEVRMKRCGTAAAFLFMMPGPKMMWEFGEMGYDISIQSKEGTDELSSSYEGETKPPHWEFLEVPERKNLFETYCKLLNFREQYAHVISDGEFVGNVDETDWPIRRIEITHPDLHFVLVGNFGTATNICIPNLNNGEDWYDFMTGKSETGGPFSLPAGEFRLYINKPVEITSIETIPKENRQIAIAPTIAQEDVRILLSEIVKVQIIAMNGIIVDEQTPTNHTFNVSKLNKGYYLVRLTGENGKQTMAHLIKQ